VVAYPESVLLLVLLLLVVVVVVVVVLLLLVLLLHPFNSLFSRIPDYLGKPAPDFTGARDDGVAVASAGSYANHLRLAPDR